MIPAFRLRMVLPPRRRRRLADAALISLAMLLPACALQAESMPGATMAPTAASSASAVTRGIEAMFAGPEATVVVGGRAYPVEPLRIFYQSRGDAPVWVDGRGLNGRGVALEAALADAKRDGLDATLYRPATDAGAGGAEQLAALELGLSTALVRYSHDLSIGRAALRPPDPDLRVTEKTIDPTALLMSAADAPDEAAFIAGLAPNDPIYRGLRAALDRYRRLDQSGAWAPLPSGETLQPGGTAPSVRTLKHVLGQTGDLQTPAFDTPVYDDALAEAVKRFQRRHGIGVTGTVTEPTRKAFNVPPATRVRQILVNMERRRWMPDDLGNPYILVNLPDYTLNVVENDTSVMRMNVVIGKATWPTPVFSDLIEYLEFNPHWNVPADHPEKGGAAEDAGQSRLCLRHGTPRLLQRQAGRSHGRQLGGHGRRRLQLPPGPGGAERARPGEIHASERIRRVPARHAVEVAVPARRCGRSATAVSGSRSPSIWPSFCSPATTTAGRGAESNVRSRRETTGR